MYFMEQDTKKIFTLLANAMSPNPYSQLQKEIPLKGHKRILLANNFLNEWGHSSSYPGGGGHSGIMAV